MKGNQKMARGGRFGSTVFVLSLTTLATHAIADDKPAAQDQLYMSKPVACTRVRGYANFEALPQNKLTADDKLVIYFEPSGFTIEKTKDGFRGLLSEDGQLRRKGQKDPLWKKEKMFSYEAANKFPPYQVYLKTDVSLKGLPPGEYEIDLTLHDDLAKKPTATTQTLKFTVYRPEEPKPKPGG